MEGDLILNKFFSANLPFSNCSIAQIEQEFLGEKKTLFEKYSNSKFFKDMADYVNTISSNNYTCNYYDINSFNSKFTKTNNSYLKMCHINIRSINLHKHELLSYLECLKYNFDIILLTESGHALVENVEECFSDYNLFIKNPNTSKGGCGILIRKNIFDNIDVIDNNLQYKCNSSNCNKCITESLWLKLSLKNEKYIVGCIYRHPDSRLDHFNEAYSNYIQHLNKNATCIIGGDFNINLLQFERNNISEFLATNLENNFPPCITLPTRITERSATLIDHIYLRLPLQKMQTKVDSGNLFCSITDHLMNFILLENNIKNIKDRPYIRLFTKTRLKKFIKYSPYDPPILSDQDNSTNIHAAFSESMVNLKKMLDKYFPLTKQSRKQFRDKKWITVKLKEDIKKKNNLFKEYTETNTEASKQLWKQAKYKVTEDIRRAQTQYYRSLLQEHNNNSQNLWKTFGNILKKSKNKVKINKIKVNNKLITDPKLVTQEFNKFFTSIGNNLANNFENQDRNNFREFLNNPVLESFSLIETSEYEIKYHLEKINIKKSTGFDDLPAKFLKISATLIAKPLAKLFNLSINTGEYPDFLKIAKVLPIYKKGEHSDMNNYRPISILSHLIKQNMMVSFKFSNNLPLKTNYLICESQAVHRRMKKIIMNLTEILL